MSCYWFHWEESILRSALSVFFRFIKSLWKRTKTFCSDIWHESQNRIWGSLLCDINVKNYVLMHPDCQSRVILNCVQPFFYYTMTCKTCTAKFYKLQKVTLATYQLLSTLWTNRSNTSAFAISKNFLHLHTNMPPLASEISWKNWMWSVTLFQLLCSWIDLPSSSSLS